MNPEESTQSVPDDIGFTDIFPVAMENNFKAGRVIIDAVLDGTLTAD